MSFVFINDNELTILRVFAFHYVHGSMLYAGYRTDLDDRSTHNMNIVPQSNVTNFNRYKLPNKRINEKTCHTEHKIGRIIVIVVVVVGQKLNGYRKFDLNLFNEMNEQNTGGFCAH